MSDKPCECLSWCSRDVREADKYHHHEDCEVKRPFARIAPVNDPKNSFIERVENLNILADMLQDTEEKDGYILTVVYLSEREYRSLPEFQGF